MTGKVISARGHSVHAKKSHVGWFCLLTCCTFILSYKFVGPGAALGSSAVVALSLWLTNKTTPVFDFRRVTIVGFWYLTYLAMIFLPAFFVFDDQEGPYRARFLFAVHTALITVPLGCLLANSICRFRPSETEDFFRGSTVEAKDPDRLRRIYSLLLVLSVLLAILYIRAVDTIPLFYLSRNPGEYLQVALLREDSFKFLDSPLLYVFSVLRSVIFPFLVILSLGFYLQTRKKLWRNLFVGTLTVAVFYCSLSVAKLPVAALVALIGFLIYYKRGGVISRKVIAGLLIGMLLFPFAVVLTAYEGESSSLDALYFIGNRLFYVPSEVVYYYFEVFPAQHPYLNGRSIDKFARLMGWAPFNTPNYVGVYAARPGDLETVSFNAAFIADLNADFGMPGVILGGILAGLIMQWFHIYAVRLRKTATVVALYSFLAYTFWFLNSTSLPIVLLSNGAIIVLVISWFFDPMAHGSHRRDPHAGFLEVPQNIPITHAAGLR
jgi:oligosaccharide repeat unit polymerase